MNTLVDLAAAAATHKTRTKATLPEDLQDERLLRRPQVELLTGLSPSGIYNAVVRNGFPLPVRLGEETVAWRATEVVEWLRSRPRGTRGVTRRSAPEKKEDA